MLHYLTQLPLHFIDTLSSMIWQIYWPLAFGLMLSSILRNVLSIDTVAKHLGKTTLTSLMLTTVLGMVSSSCSYAAASLSRTLITKKASLSNAMAFLVASTNLIFEMFIVLVSLLGWQFLWGEITGGIILIMLTALIFLFYPKKQQLALQAHLIDIHNPAAVSACGMNMDSQKTACSPDNHVTKTASMSHCDMDMTVHKQDPAIKTISLMNKVSRSASFFQMDIAMIGKEIIIGVVISSLLIAIIPINWWQTLFVNHDMNIPSYLHSFLDVIIGIFVAVIAYVCSVGNLLLAAALWHGGISFGGVMGFILADVLTIPMTQVYKKYYGKQAAMWIVGFLFVAILATGLLVNVIFNQLDWSTSKEAIRQLHQSGFGLNITSLMNIIFIPLSIWYYFLGRKTNQQQGMDMKM